VYETDLSLQNFPLVVKEKASIYVPAIGKVTIVVLLRNLLRIVQNRQAQSKSANGKNAPSDGVQTNVTVI
jgi:methylenetetrahydrofolate dehydrogenase (NAD+)